MELTSPREQFALTAADLVESDDSVALVYAEISGAVLRSRSSAGTPTA